MSSTLIRLGLGRSTRYSFAYTGEDKIIEGIIKPLIYQPGFYVDVGCNHPKFLSNTYGLYRKGWRGVCIDANERLIKKYRLFRPKDIAVSAVVSNKASIMNYYTIENDVLSTVEKQNVIAANKSGLSYNVSQRETFTLTAILQKFDVPEEFDVLSIDAEEHDYNVLISLDFSLYSPKLIIVEDESFNPLNLEENRFLAFLNDKDYQLVGFVLKNLYFKRK